MKYFIIIDMQNDFCTGSLANPAAVAIIPKIAEMAKQKKAEGYTIIATQDTHHGNYLNTQEGKNLPVPHCIDDTEGWKVVDQLAPLVDYYLVKEQFGTEYWRTYFLDTLTYEIEDSTEPEEIELCGTVTSICVASNFSVLKAEFPEVPITVHKDLCADLTSEAHEAALTVMKA